MPRERIRRSAGVRGTLAFVGLLLLVLGAGLGLESAAERRDVARKAQALTHGDPRHGRELAGRFGCGGCHEIPRVPGAHGRVGPPLDGFASRAYVGGVLANTPANLTLWLQDPRAIDPKTAMPSVGLDARQARDVAAFLYTLN